MKTYSVSSRVCLIFLAISTPLFAQQVEHSTIKLNPPAVINFTELADYQRMHPSPPKPQRFIEQGEDREGKYKFHHREIPSDAKKFDVALPENVLRTISPDPTVQFNGTLDNGSIIPPDVGGTVGDNFLLQTSNQEFDIYTKSGTLVNSLDINNFFSSNSPSGFFDPHAAFDVIHHRFVVCVDAFYTNNHSALLIAVTETNDPNGNWFIYDFDAIGNANDFLDYPQIGFNNNWVVLTGNDFLSNGNTTTKVYALNRLDLYSGSSSTVHTFTDGTVFGESPAITMDSILSTEYIVADWDGSNLGFGYIKLFKITGTPSNPTYSAGSTIGVNQPWNENSVNAPQLGSTHKLEVSDTRINSPVYSKGSLWFTHNVFLPASSANRASVDWWEVNPSSATLTQFGRLDDSQGQVFYYYPSISANNNGDALLAYNISSSSMYVSSQYSYHASADTTNGMEDGNLFKAGQASYYKTFGGSRNRWGDFSTTATDPIDNSFWTFQEFATTPANTWATVVANVGGPPCSDVPSAGIINSVFNSVCPGEGTILNLVNYSLGVTGIQFQWQQSTDGVNDWTNATGLGNTSYRYETGALNDSAFFRCVVTCVNSGLADTTEALQVKLNGFVTIANDTICSPGVTDLVASSADTVYWFEADTSVIPIHVGDTLSANVTGDTTIYVSTNTLSHNSVGAPTSSIGTGGYYNFSYATGMVFNALSNFVLDTVYIYPNSTGTIKVNLLDVISGLVVDSVSMSVTSSQVHNKTAVPLSMNVTGGALYYLNAVGSTISSLYRNTSGVNYPYTISGAVSLLHAINEADGYYYFFYDWKITSGCNCDKFPVHVHIDSVVVIAFASSDTICSGDSVMLIASGAQNYLWQPDNVSGGAIISDPQMNTTYTVTGTDHYSCSASAQIDVFVNNCATNASDIIQSSSFMIYPNPTTGKFVLTFDGAQEGTYSIAILNTLGQEMMERKIKITSLAQVTTLDASQLSKGVYFIRVASDHQEWM
ncbi:MAG: T9SS type A sorting domain-containing protein, partial [Chitinophagales bacterium]